MTYTLSCIAGGFLAGWVARSQLEKRLRGGNLGRDPLVMNEGRTIRGHGNGAPTTPKPKIVKVRFGNADGTWGPWMPTSDEADVFELARLQAATIDRLISNWSPPSEP